MRNKAKTFCYVSLGILALAGAYHLGARNAGASYVPPGEMGVVGAGLVGCGQFDTVLLSDGEVWTWTRSGGWQGDAAPLPLPVSEIRFWDYYRLVTRSGELWALNEGSPGWSNKGAPPGLVATEPSTWGKVKAKSRE